MAMVIGQVVKIFIKLMPQKCCSSSPLDSPRDLQKYFLTWKGAVGDLAVAVSDWGLIGADRLGLGNCTTHPATAG